MGNGYHREPLASNVEEMFIGPFGSALKNNCFVAPDEGFCMVYEQKHAIQKTMDVETRYVDEKKYKELKRFTVYPGDIIVSCRGTIGEVFQIPDNAPMGIMHPSIMKIRLKEEAYDKTFFVFLLTEYMRDHISQANGTGVKMAVTATTLGKEAFIKPPLPIQKEWNRFVRQSDKSQFIEIFSVKNGWPLVRLEELCSSIVRGPFGSALKVSFFVDKGPGTVKVYEQKNAIQSSANIGDSYVTQEKYLELKRFECGPEDFIMSCSGTIGCLYQLPKDAEIGIINQALCKFHLNDRILPEIFLIYMKNSVDQLETKGSAIKNIGSVSYIKNMEIALPPMDKQNQFAALIRQSDKSKFAALMCSKLSGALIIELLHSEED